MKIVARTLWSHNARLMYRFRDEIVEKKIQAVKLNLKIKTKNQFCPFWTPFDTDGLIKAKRSFWKKISGKRLGITCVINCWNWNVNVIFSTNR